MRLLIRHGGLALVAFSSLVSAPAIADTRTLTLKQAVELSLGDNPDIAVAKEAVAASDSETTRTKGQLFPVLHVQASANYYREPYVLPFGDLGNFTLHDQTTTTTAVSLTQPLTGLAYLSELVGSQEHSANVARADYDRVRLDTTYKTADAYLRVLEARAAAQVAHQSVEDIASELDRAEKLRKADTYTDVDVLRFKSAKAAADQAALHADNAKEAAGASLVVQIGLADGEVLDVTDDLPTPAPAMTMTLEQAQQRAMTTRPELRAARERLRAAEDSRKVAKLGYFPDIRAGANWLHATGVQPFQPKDEEWLGLTLSWNVWDWGQVHQQIIEAEHKQTQAELDAGSLGNTVKLDVRKKWLDAKTGYDSLALASTQQQAAEEAYRLQQVRFQAGAATTTDVLDAQIDASRARLAVAVARYDYYLALVALARSVGDFPST
ncbi:MAG TPA: TolC family protein [Kofleriaceae bacterium]|jgi:outer membrane protein TolC|nr:TolC family protein [Kofleriaceae bacterium]